MRQRGPLPVPGPAVRERSDRRETEAALRESEARLRDFAEVASDWFWETDEELRFVFVSGRFTEITGVPVTDILGKRREESGVIEWEAGSLERHLRDLRERRAFSDFVHGRRGALGAVTWISISGKPRFDANGRFLGYRGTGRDVTQSILAEQALRESERRFRGLIELMSDWYWEQDAQLRYTFVSGGLPQETEFLPEELLGRQLRECPRVEIDDKDWQAHVDRLEACEPFVDFVIKWRRTDGAPRYISMSGCPVFDRKGTLDGYRGVGRDVTERMHSEERMQQLAYHDALTGLANRLYLLNGLHLAIARARRAHRRVALLFLDLDGFKRINDELGHDAGDRVLVELASRLRGCLRETDLIARLGGDEFVVVLEDIASKDASTLAARRILTEIGAPCDIAGRELRVSASIGVSFFPDDSDDARVLLKHADAAMYRSKRLGKGRISFHAQ